MAAFYPVVVVGQKRACMQQPKAVGGSDGLGFVGEPKRKERMRGRVVLLAG